MENINFIVDCIDNNKEYELVKFFGEDIKNPEHLDYIAFLASFSTIFDYKYTFAIEWSILVFVANHYDWDNRFPTEKGSWNKGTGYYAKEVSEILLQFSKSLEMIKGTDGN